MVAIKRSVEIEEQVRALMAEARDDRDANGGDVAERRRASRDEALARSARRAARSTRSTSGISSSPASGIAASSGSSSRTHAASRATTARCAPSATCRGTRSSPRSLARLFMTAFRRGWCDGLFVTSGIPRDPVFAMERMLQLVEILRFTHGYRGYLHAKALAGAEPGQIERLVRLVDRVSYNLEAPCQRALDEHAPGKSVASGLALLETARDAALAVREARRASARQAPAPLPRLRSPPPDAGASRLRASAWRHESRRDDAVRRRARQGVRSRAPVVRGRAREEAPHPSSAVRGVPSDPRHAAGERPRDAPAPRAAPLSGGSSDARVRLLARRSSCTARTATSRSTTIRSSTWALANPDRFPVELTTASREELQRVPGFGPRAVERILETRARESLRDPADLRRLGVQVGRAGGFVTLRGRLIGTRVHPGRLSSQVPLLESVYEFSPGTFR